MIDGDKVSARFTSAERGRKGLRWPTKPSGGVNKRYFEGLKECKNEDERKAYKKAHAKDYTPWSERFGANDPEL